MSTLQMQALTLTSFSSPPVLTTKPIPSPIPGSLVVKILSTAVLSYANEVYCLRTGARDYPMPLPLTIGSSAIARVHAIGPDTTIFSEGQLVLVNSFIKARDDPRNQFLFGLHEGGTEGGQKLMKDLWRDSTYAQYTLIPLENAHPLPESTLTTTLGLALSSLNYISRLLVPFGGLMDLSPEPGSTLLVYPSTGNFGSCAVELGLALGCFVIAAGRSQSSLSTVSLTLSNRSSGRLATAVLEGSASSIQKDVESLTEAAKSRDIEYYIDLSPPQAAKSTHMTAAMLAMAAFGKIALMGGVQESIEVNYALMMYKCLRVQGRFMYEREHVKRLICMVEAGLVRLDGVRLEEFPLECWRESFDAAEKKTGVGKGVVICPN